MVANVTAALEFIYKVEMAYGAGSQERDGFINAMKDFKCGR